MQVAIQFSANLPLKITKKESWFVASCPILDVHSQGETEELARENLKEALSLFFQSCFERGVLDDVLKECGFKAATPSIEKEEEQVASREDYIQVPIPFLVNQDTPDRCHA
ncbi:MAG: type II toxin-antitoxin system HicB family antitoxin [Desulfatiglandaceae bacterium]